MRRFSIVETDFDIALLREGLLRNDAGAYASFEGWVRDHHAGRAVSGLHYQAYAALANSEGERILVEALARFAIADVRCVHRIGELAVGARAVWVGVSAGHRDAAFDACRFVIDQVKTHVPIWKQERYVDGQVGWLHPAVSRDP